MLGRFQPLNQTHLTNGQKGLVSKLGTFLVTIFYLHFPNLFFLPLEDLDAILKELITLATIKK